MHVYCFLGDVWEGVGKSIISVTGRVSSVVQGLVGDKSEH